MGPQGQTLADSPTSGANVWLDIRVIYVRISAPAISYAEAPERLLLRCLPRNFRSELEINGARIPPSEPASLNLRLDRMDESSSEAMYVSTDKLRLSSSLPFAILHNDEQLAEGLVSCREGLPPSWAVGVEGQALSSNPRASWDVEPSSHCRVADSQPLPLEWGMRCNCTVSPTWPGFFIKSIQDLTTGQPVQPSLEVCVVGKCDGTSIMLTDQVQLLARKRSQWKGGLDAIPESEGSGRGAIIAWRPPEDPSCSSPMDELDPREGEAAEQNQRPQGALERLWPTPAGLENLYGEVDENGEMTWFNAGVRVGVGIGLGMCIGVGIGVGLIVKTYQATTRPFRGRLL